MAHETITKEEIDELVSTGKITKYETGSEKEKDNTSNEE